MHLHCYCLHLAVKLNMNYDWVPEACTCKKTLVRQKWNKLKYMSKERLVLMWGQNGHYLMINYTIIGSRIGNITGSLFL